MQISPSLPRAGDLVRIRRRRWRIVDLRVHDACQIVTVAGADARGFGATRRYIAPFDTIEPLGQPRRIRVVTPNRWRRRCRAWLAEATPPGALGSGRLARIDLLPHQLEPALAVVAGLGSRLLLADEVGLGKTIQAGLVLSELRARAAAERALILAPAGLRDQWAKELAQRFDLEAKVVDARDVRRHLATLPVGVNPWATIDVAIASIDYVKRPEILAAIRACRWDVVIVDEAHGVANDNERRGAVAALADRAGFVLLLTATPHNGDRRAFLSLCGLGAHDDRLLFFRRSRQDVRPGVTRRIQRLLVRPSAEEARMHALVAAFSRAVRDRWTGGRERSDARDAVWLALTVLNKRALSSARSLERTVERRLSALAADGATELGKDNALQLALPLSDPDGEASDADRAPDLDGLTLGNPARERAMLRELAAAAHLAARRETKIAALDRFLRRVAEPVLIFTEFRDTLLHLQDALGRPSAILHGGLGREERAAALADFGEGRQPILLATDAAGEGLNLHHTCRIVINLELPWNPVRLEQRIGRVDRIGQHRTVHAVHLIARDTAETRILERLRTRIASAQLDITAADPVGAGSGSEEEAVARLVIDGSTRDDAKPSHTDSVICEGSSGGPIVPVTLRAEAAEEASRLANARRFPACREDDAAAIREMDGACLTFARNRSTRARLGARTLLIFRSSCEDGCGRLIESTPVPIVVGWPCGERPSADRRGVSAFRKALEALEALETMLPEVTARADEAAAPWREAALASARRFFETRLARARAIARMAADRPFVRYQPGLFDRRAEGRHLAVLDTASEAAGQAASRIAEIERASRIRAGPPELLLVLVP